MTLTDQCKKFCSATYNKTLHFIATVNEKGLLTYSAAAFAECRLNWTKVCSAMLLKSTVNIRQCANRFMIFSL